MINELPARDNESWITSIFFRENGGIVAGAGKNLVNEINFYDTTLGGNRALNAPPQSCRYADPKIPSISPMSQGMGRSYKRLIDNNAQIVSFQMGIPKYNAMTTVLASYYDRDLDTLARDGSFINELAYTAGNTLGILFSLPFQAFFGLGRLYHRAMAVLTGNPYSKLYYMQPAMSLFWNSASLVYNKMLVDVGFFDPARTDDLELDSATNRYKMKSTVDNFTDLSNLLPDVIKPQKTSSGNTYYHVDLKSIAGRSQRMAIAFEDSLYNIQKSIADSGLTGDAARQEFTNQVNALKNAANLVPQTKAVDMESSLENYKNSPAGQPAESNVFAADVVDGSVDYTTADGGTIPVPTEPSVWDKLTDLGNYFQGDLRDGSAFVSFKVDAVKTVSLSLSNTTKAAPMKEAVNSAANLARDKYVALNGGNIGDGIIADSLETAISAASNFVQGLVDGTLLNSLSGITNGAQLTAPDVYDDSQTDMQDTIDFTFKVVLPYGNKFCVATRLLPIIAIVTAMGAPRMVGKSARRGPWLCRCHCTGVSEIKLGIVKSVQMELCDSNIRRTIDNLPHSCTFTITVERLEKDFAVAIHDSIVGELFSFSAFDEDSPMTDFISMVTGLSLAEQYYTGPRISRAWRKTLADWDSFASPAYWSQWFRDTIPGAVVSAFTKVGDI